MKLDRVLVALLVLGVSVFLFFVAFSRDTAESPVIFETEEHELPDGARELVDARAGQAESTTAPVAKREELQAMSTPEVSAEPGESSWGTLRGTVELTDGTSTGGIELAVLDPDAPLWSGRGLADGKLNQDFLLAHGWASKEGAFEFELKHPVPKEGFRIEQLNYRKVGQNHQIYEEDLDAPIKHVIPGGRVSVRLLDPSGGPVYGQLRTKVFFRRLDSGLDSEPYSSITIPGGGQDVRFLYVEPARITVTVVRPHDGASGKLENVVLDPNSPAEVHQLTVFPLTETGRIKITVLDQNDLQVLDYGVRVSAGDGSFGPRYFYGSEIGAEGIVDGLPMGIMKIELADRFRSPPSLYSTDGVPQRWSGVARDSPIETVFRVNIQSRLAFELQREGEERERLGVSYRKIGSPSEEWVKNDFLSIFLDEGGVTFGGMEGNGVYYSEVLSAGHFEVEVFEIESDKVVWSGNSQVHEGRLSPILLRL